MGLCLRLSILTFNSRTHNLDERQRDLGVPLLWSLCSARPRVGSLTSNVFTLKAVVLQLGPLTLRMRLLSVSRILLQFEQSMHDESRADRDTLDVSSACENGALTCSGRSTARSARQYRRAHTLVSTSRMEGMERAGQSTDGAHRVREVEGPASEGTREVSGVHAHTMPPGRAGSVLGRCSHGVVLRVVAEALGDGGVAEEEGEVGEDILARGRDGARRGELAGAVYGCLLGHGCEFLRDGVWSVRRLVSGTSRCLLCEDT